ncbi:WG repeat-containing protein [Dyella tabacisoli]|nr:WG repeat-containing protein [Dyella tabacisoli]
MNIRDVKLWLAGIVCVSASMSGVLQAQPTTAPLMPYLDANGRYGFVDASGTLVIPARYVDAKPFSDGRAAVVADDMWGYIDTAGRWVVKPRYSSAENYDRGEAVARIQVDSNLKSSKGGWIALPNPSNALPWRHDAYTTIHRLDTAGRVLERWKSGDDLRSDKPEKTPAALDKLLGTPAYQGSFVTQFVPPLYPVGHGCEHDTPAKFYAALNRGDCRIVFFDAQARALNSQVYSYYDVSRGFTDDRLMVTRDGKSGYIDSHGVEVIPCTFDAAYWFENGYAVVRSKDRGMGVIDTQGRMLIDFGQGDLMYDHLTYPPTTHGYFVGHRKSGWGVVDPSQNRDVVPFTYAHEADLKVLGSGGTQLAVAARDDKQGWCVLDSQGHTLSCGYKQVASAREGVIAVQGSNGSWGAIDLTGKMILSPRYDERFVFSNGLARVRRGEYRFYIDALGKEYVAPALVNP